MRLFRNNKEWIVITAVWLVVFFAEPLYMYYMSINDGIDYKWSRGFVSWGYTLVFLLLFLFHHYFLVPRLLIMKKYTRYSIGVLLSVLLFIFFLIVYEPSRQLRPDMPMPEQRGFAPLPTDEQRFPKPHGLPLAPPDFARFITLLLMFGMDVGAVAWFNEQKLRRDMLILERQNLKQELQHLRYQINPHFFMNTLNNIHALVDIDQEKAKRAIIMLSKLLRYALYENSSSMVQLKSEVEFLKQFISLMELRYNNEKIDIQYTLPEDVSDDVKMPPLLLATFVENAFKHGVSYLSYSFVHLHLWIEDDGKTIRFQCNNSRHPSANSNTDDGAHGIGLENVRKQLNLQYHDNYSLVINDANKELFGVDLTLRNKTQK